MKFYLRFEDGERHTVMHAEMCGLVRNRENGNGGPIRWRGPYGNIASARAAALGQRIRMVLHCGRCKPSDR